MKKIIILIVISLVMLSLSAETSIWSKGTTDVLPQGRWEVGIFQPLSYGLNETTELSTYALADLVMPNITLKKFWKNLDGLEFTSKHSFIYPSLFLNVMAKEGAFGILPDNSVIPHIFVLNNQFMLSYKYNEYLNFIPKIGFSAALVIGDSDFPTIDMPIVYNRTSIYHENIMFNIGLDVRGSVSSKFEYLVDIDKFIMDKEYCEYSYEHKLLLIWKINRKFALSAGYKLSYSDYPSTMQRRTDFLPLIDLQVGFK
ncbi:MAG: hypothetical protein HOD64_01460 [Candidatus Cloacimonetes bacterium]|jgi:hypothetical protein|nr:hypothetical protein [Candidatus Cloacimonadota bacterium]MBT4331918.1 hypothetical protein [Candidatus Cloacimonadota bacterium]